MRGTAEPVTVQVKTNRDHPRTCGEQSDHEQFIVLAEGITPAHAGNSEIHAVYTGVEQDHPRTCGEQCIYRPIMNPVEGSPPRVRGTAVAIGLMANSGRITPAGAGNSRTKIR